MKVKIRANEVTEGEIDFVSLVKHGANRSPFKIIKMDDLSGFSNDYTSAWQGLAAVTANILASGRTTENNTVKISDLIKEIGDQPDNGKVETRRSREDIEAIVSTRRRRAALNARLQKLWESPQPDSERIEQYVLDEIEKAEIELEALGYQEPDQFAESSAFFFRGGSSVHSPVTDSAFENVNSLGVAKQADVRKAEQMIDLNPNPMGTSTDESEITKVDLSLGFKL